MGTPRLGATITPITNRDPVNIPADTAAVRAIAQAAVNVELFTIPLYMTALYSLHGTHEINAKGITYYQGRTWPGLAPAANPASPNAFAFNLVFSVFIQEMLHLQMAGNLASAVGVTPRFTRDAHLDAAHGWICYGPEKSVIPHIIDLADTTTYAATKVRVGPLDANSVELFLAIEQSEEAARADIKADKIGGYFPAVPFAGWSADKTEADLPPFGTIGWMYECYAAYLAIQYSDGTSLWDHVFDPRSVQRDLFNARSSGHPQREFPAMDTQFCGGETGDAAFNKAIGMMSAITDQGEGACLEITRYRRGGLVVPGVEVEQRYRPSERALEADYPSYDAKGEAAPSASTTARYDNSRFTHFERFVAVKGLLPSLTTWAQWHAAGNRWTAADLTTAGYDPAGAPKNIPTPEQVAGALNRLKDQKEIADIHATLSKVAVGAIYGVTSVLDQFWQNPTTEFPYPSMSGSGDRVSICWAILGEAPDLSIGIGTPDQDRLYHACQGLSLDAAHPADSCAAIEVYHTCRGSNGCHAQGGCGFAQLDTGGGSCSAARRATPTLLKGGEVLAAAAAQGKLYSAPSDNKCKSYGGCAVPISASQLFPSGGTMKLYDFAEEPPHTSEPLKQNIEFAVGDSIYDKAWEAYTKVLEARGQTPGDKPSPTDLRIALPPST